MIKKFKMPNGNPDVPNRSDLNLEVIVTYRVPCSGEDCENSLGANLLAMFNRAPEPMTDYSIRSKVDGRDIPCHKFILAARSTMFKYVDVVG